MGKRYGSTDGINEQMECIQSGACDFSILIHSLGITELSQRRQKAVGPFALKTRS